MASLILRVPRSAIMQNRTNKTHQETLVDHYRTLIGLRGCPQAYNTMGDALCDLGRLSGGDHGKDTLSSLLQRTASHWEFFPGRLDPMLGSHAAGFVQCISDF
jgi:hypothetical protein